MASRSTAPEKRPGFFAQLRSLFTFTKAEFSWLGWALIGIVVLAGGQFAVEHLTAFSVPVSVFITIMGGVYFLYLILRSKGL